MCRRNPEPRAITGAAAVSRASTAYKSDKQSSRSEARPKIAALFHELQAQLRIANPTIVGMLLYKLPWLWSLHFVAELGSDALAAAALATTLSNVTGMSFAVGLSFGLSTLTGQARGELLRKGELWRLRKREDKSSYTTADTDVDLEDYQQEEKEESDPLLGSLPSSYSEGPTYEKPNVTIAEEDLEDIPIQPLVCLYRGLFIQLLFVVPVGLWWIRGIEPLLLALGQGRKLSQMTEVYLRILTPGLWSYSINWTFTAWLQSIDMADVPAYAAFCGFALHIPFNILFVRILGFGYEGVAMATVAFQLLQPILICAYLFATTHGRSRMLEHTGAKGIGRTHLNFRKEMRSALSCLTGIRQYLVLALPGIIVVSEWWASEVCIFLAGRLGPNPSLAIGAMSIYQSICSFCVMLSLGFSYAASARVGLFLGTTDARRAKLASYVSMAGAIVLSAIMGSILYFTPHEFFPSLFTPDQNVISETITTIPFLAIYVIADGMNVTLNGILKGCGMQAIAMPIVIVSYWCVGVPLGYYNAFISNGGTSECQDSRFCGTAGLVAGMTMATWTHFILLLVTVLGAINWKKEVVKAQERVSQSHLKKSVELFSHEQ